MAGSEISQFEGLLANLESQLVVEAQRRLDQVDVLGRVAVHDHVGHVAVAEAAGGMIAVAVAIDQVRDRGVGDFFDLRLQPGRRLFIDRVGDHHAGLGNHEHIDVKAVLKAVNIVGHTRNFALDVLRRDGAGAQHQDQGG